MCQGTEGVGLSPSINLANGKVVLSLAATIPNFSRHHHKTKLQTQDIVKSWPCLTPTDHSAEPEFAIVISLVGMLVGCFNVKSSFSYKCPNDQVTFSLDFLFHTIVKINWKCSDFDGLLTFNALFDLESLNLRLSNEGRKIESNPRTRFLSTYLFFLTPDRVFLLK